MNDPQVFNLPADTWTKVISNESAFLIAKLQTVPSGYFWTYRVSNGDNLPLDLSDAINLFEKDNFESIQLNNVVDVYIYSKDAPGSVLVGVYAKNPKTRIQQDSTFILEHFICQKKEDLELASAPTAPGTLTTDEEYQIVVTNATNVLVGDWIEIFQENTAIPYFAWLQAKVLAKSVNTLTLDRPVGYPYDPTDLENPVTIRSCNISLNVNGSVTRSVFDVRLPNLKLFAFQITRAIITMVHTGVPDMGKFGGITALTNGVVYGGKTNYPLPDGGHFQTHKTLVVVRDNDDFSSSAFDVRFDDRSGGSGDYGTSVRRSLGGPDKNDTLTPLLGGDALPISDISAIIQDDLSTGFSKYTTKIQGKLVKISDLQL